MHGSFPISVILFRRYISRGATIREFVVLKDEIIVADIYFRDKVTADHFN